MLRYKDPFQHRTVRLNDQQIGALAKSGDVPLAKKV